MPYKVFLIAIDVSKTALEITSHGILHYLKSADL